MIPGWKLQFMAKTLFREFLRNTDRILDIAEEMLEKHIDDEEVVEDNSKLIAQKKAELEKLEKRLNKLISMRADDEITKEQFMNMKSEVDTQIASLQEQICELSPAEKVTETSDVPDYNERITLLRYALERYTNFDTDEDIPEAVIEAFVEKIVVNENSFDWYLHFSGDDKTPKTCNVEGDKKAHIIELFGVSYAPALVEGCTGCYCTEEVIQDYLKIDDFTLFQVDAEMYFKAKSEKREFHNWRDIRVNVYV